MAKRNKNREDSPKATNWNMLKVLDYEVRHLKAYTTSSWVIYQNKLRMQWLDIAIRSVECSLDIVKRNISNDLFSVFALLCTRWISHHQSIFNQLNVGYYDETLALHRMLLETTDLITYFSHYPDEATAWRQWSALVPTWEILPGYQSFNKMSQVDFLATFYGWKSL